MPNTQGPGAKVPDEINKAAQAAGPYVSLFDQIAELAAHLPVSHVVADTKIGRYIAAVVHYMEHGPEILEAAAQATAHVRDQLSNESFAKRTAPPQVDEVLAAPYPQAQDTNDTTVQLEQLKAQVAALEGAQRTTTVTSEATD
jgi:hypothetical protein